MIFVKMNATKVAENPYISRYFTFGKRVAFVNGKRWKFEALGEKIYLWQLQIPEVSSPGVRETIR